MTTAGMISVSSRCSYSCLPHTSLIVLTFTLASDRTNMCICVCVTRTAPPMTEKNLCPCLDRPESSREANGRFLLFQVEPQTVPEVGERLRHPPLLPACRPGGAQRYRSISSSPDQNPLIPARTRGTLSHFSGCYLRCFCFDELRTLLTNS